MIKEKTNETQIKDLQKRRNAAKMEIMNLNAKLKRMSSKMTTEDTQKEEEPVEEQKDDLTSMKEYK
jgi:uncharacterized protein involved in exopolysaccharide biosynthesis